MSIAKLADLEQYFSPLLGQDISIVHPYFSPEKFYKDWISVEKISKEPLPTDILRQTVS